MKAEPPSAARRRTMQAQKGRDTKIELVLRRELHKRGLRYRVQYGRADIAFVKAKLAVFTDGCFWHGCPLHYQAPKANAEYWEAKREMNLLRDRGVEVILRLRGWRALRFWEHELASEEGVQRAAALVVALLREEAEAGLAHVVKPPVTGGILSLGRGVPVTVGPESSLATLA